MANAVFNLSDLNGRNGFVLNGIEAFNYSSLSVSEAGDINGDGIDDLIIGAPAGNPNSGYSGQSYVVFGRREGFAAQFSLSSLDGNNGFTFKGTARFESLGNSVSGAGDINGDGIDDLIIGAPQAALNNQYSGQSYVIFGRREGFAAQFNRLSLDGSNGFILNGISPYDSSGYSVSGAGDINGDGIDDLIIGAPFASPNGNFSGQSYVVFGSRAGFAAQFSLSSLDGSNGFALNGIVAESSSLSSVSEAGDINGDGIDDLIIGASAADPNGRSSGQSYVVFGSREGFAASVNLSNLNGSNGFALNGISPYDFSGDSVSGAGDINGDGINDLIIGAPNADSNGNGSGQSYVVFGSRNGFAASVNLSDLNGSNGFALNGISPYDSAGSSVSGAGDINGDGIDDLIIGAPGANVNGRYLGQSYVVFGSRKEFAPSLNLSDLNDSNGFALNGIAIDLSDQSVSEAGDINGDGIDDLTIAITFTPTGGRFSGQSYVVYGNAPSVLDLNGTAAGIDFTATFTGSTTPIVASSLSLSDRNSSTIAGATITITNLLNGTAESLSANTNGTNIAANYLNGVLTLTGTDAIASYQQVLRTITYNNNASSPNASDRKIEFVVDDGAAHSNTSRVATTTLSFSNVINGTPGNDSLIGTPGADRINGFGGDDFIDGRGNNDTIDGGTGNLDRMFGGAGNDTITDPDGVNGANGGTGNDTINVIFASNWDNDNNSATSPRSDGKITGGFGNDTIIVTMNNSRFFINLKGDEPINNQSQDGNDIVTLRGSYANSIVDLGGGNNIFNGGAGRDNVMGKNGDDVLIGNRGNDILTGGEGSDRFVLSANTGTDTVTDFTDNRDRLGLSGGLLFGQLSIRQGMGANVENTLISLSSNNEVLAVLRGVQANSITSTDFVVV